MTFLRHAFATLAAAALPLLASAATLQFKVTDRDGQPVPDAVVEVLSASGAVPRQPAPPQVTINQSRMRFVPRVTVVQPGTRVVFTNQDGFDHHVRGAPATWGPMLEAAGFQFRLAGATDHKPLSSSEVVFDKPGVTLLGCFLHASMRGYVLVAESPWVALTGADGVAVMDDLPAGAAVVKLWQADEVAEMAPYSVVLGPQPLVLTRQLTVAARRR
ncbi:MAG: plastocyanin [Curvibacter sp.]|nr:plastocyanin [Curvibacter sp.]